MRTAPISPIVLTRGLVALATLIIALFALLSPRPAAADEEEEAPVALDADTSEVDWDQPLLQAAEESGAAPLAAEGIALFGAPDVVGVRPLPIATVAAAPDTYHEKLVAVRGTLDEVCAMKGCWMTLESGEGRPPVRVRFKDYAFFVPRNAAGHTATLVGVFKQTTIDEELARHYLEDAGAPREEIEKVVGPQPALEVLARSVALDHPEKLEPPFGADTLTPAKADDPGAAKMRGIAPAGKPTSKPTGKPTSRPKSK